MTITAPEVRALDLVEAHALLARQHVGRIAYAFHDQVDIEPIHYAFNAGWIFARTSVGTKLSRLAHHPWCAFEVDEVRGVFEWASVVVKGSFHVLDPEVGSGTYARALAAMRDLVPDTFSPHDPVPGRTILIGISANEITGRSAAIDGSRSGRGDESRTAASELQ